MPIMNDQYHHLGENGAASHQSGRIRYPGSHHLTPFSNLKANKLLKEGPNHDSNIITARLHEKVIILPKKTCSQLHPKKVGLPAKNICSTPAECGNKSYQTVYIDVI